MKNKTEKAVSLSALRKKLYSAVAMLLVASIMMVSSSYAWLVLSTAPEITGISTQIGANGSLEIALLNTESYNDITKIVNADIDESDANFGTVPALSTSNLSWGNLVSLGDSSYGLNKITLNPGRLNISTANEDGDMFQIGQNLIKAPIYNADGRIIGLNVDDVISATYSTDSEGFSVANQLDYGVRAVGTTASMTAAQQGINAARSALTANKNEATKIARSTLKTNGNALGNVAMGIATKGEDATFSIDDVKALQSLAQGLGRSLGYLDAAVRQLYVAYLHSELVAFADDTEKNAAIDVVVDPNTALADIQAAYPLVALPAVRDGETAEDIIALLEKDEGIVAAAIADCKDLIEEAKAAYELNEVIAVMRPLVDHTKMSLNGTPIDQLSSNIEALLNSVIGGGGVNITVPSGSGILSDIADYADNYDAEILMEDVTYNNMGPMDLKARMTTVTSVKPVYLQACANTLNSYNAGSGDASQAVIADFYGYALDLAFRTNVSDSELQLQTAPRQRIYDTGEASTLTQGGGSYMQFRSSANISASKMLKLMSALRVVFVDKDQMVLSIAALDTKPGQDAYILLEDDDTKKTEGKHAKLNVADVQNSDYITLDEYNELPETSEVEISADGTIKAPLYLHSFAMTVSTKNSTAEETKYTGGITLGEKLDSSAITALEESVAKQITAIVYLDGSFVDNSMVAANGSQSMTGTLNLQFSSSVELIPMENQGLRDMKAEDEGDETEPPADDEEGGEDLGGGADDGDGEDPAPDENGDDTPTDDPEQTEGT
ncbi:MAG: hypothetical protein IKU72_02525 [Oscillospiraceae bacterium]|nr:hypothetical protein [Oscillospiraceae bacterium]